MYCFVEINIKKEFYVRSATINKKKFMFYHRNVHCTKKEPIVNSAIYTITFIVLFLFFNYA